MNNKLIFCKWCNYQIRRNVSSDSKEEYWIHVWSYKEECTKRITYAEPKEDASSSKENVLHG